MIASIKDLEKLLKLLRKQGVTDFKHEGLELKLGDLPQDHRSASEEPETADDPYANFPQNMLTPEQLAFYASGGRPEDDPFNQRAVG